MQNELMDAAIEYAKQGFAVFPLKPRNKTPIQGGGFKNATTDIPTIERWWNKTPNANIGIATGQMSGGIVVIDLDIDDDKGINGYDSLRDWQRMNGDLPDTADSITGRGGYHLFFRTSEKVKCRTGILEGVDVRGDGGYVVAPPSIHYNGNQYMWECPPDETPIAKADKTVFMLLNEGSPKPDMNGQPLGSIPDKLSEGTRNDTLFKIACSFQGRGISDGAVLAAVKAENQSRCVPPLEDEEVEKIVESALKLPKGTMNITNRLAPKAKQYITLEKKPTAKKDFNGNPVMVNKQSINNVVTVLQEDEELAGKIRYDVIGYTPKYFGQLPWRNEGDTFGDWRDYDDANLKSYLDTYYGLKGNDIYESGFIIVAETNKFNPITDWLEALPQWDGKQRVSTLLSDFLGADQDQYTSEVIHVFMQGAINRAYTPGCKFDYMPVLVGEQGSGKSMFLRRLAVNDVWFDDNLNTVEGTQAVERLRGKWILELAELLAVKKQKEVEGIKAFVTTQVDSYREPYARRTTDRPRACVFAATTNDYNFLTDRTGNRRFLPVAVHKERATKDLFAPGIREYFEQCWAEALYIYKTQHPALILSADIQQHAIDIQKNFLEEDAWVGMIQEHLDHCMEKYVCAAYLWQNALDQPGLPKRYDSGRILSIMRNEITGWDFAGTQRCGNYGKQKAFQKVAGFEPQFEEFDADSVPF